MTCELEKPETILVRVRKPVLTREAVGGKQRSADGYSAPRKCGRQGVPNVLGLTDFTIILHLS
jgi:hypothetical protein